MALKLSVHDLEQGQTHVFYGSKDELQNDLRTLYPSEVEGLGLEQAVQKLNEDGFVEVSVTADADSKPYGEHNLLPENDLTDQDEEDPWVREADE